MTGWLAVLDLVLQLLQLVGTLAILVGLWLLVDRFAGEWQHQAGCPAAGQQPADGACCEPVRGLPRER